MPNFLKRIIGLLISVVVFVLAFTIVPYIINWVHPPTVTVIEPTIPPIQTSSSSSSISSESIKSLDLLIDEYKPSQSPFAVPQYNQAPQIVYKGNFSGAILHIEGNVIGNEEVMLLFNFGRETGIINGSRSAPNRVNLIKTKNMGGLFGAGNSIFANVNLLDDELGSSSSNFGICDGVCTFKFITSSDTAQVARILTVPVRVNGSFGGAAITSMKIEYLCGDTSNNCKISICNTGEAAYDCIKDKYSPDEANQWHENYIKNLENK